MQAKTIVRVTYNGLLKARCESDLEFTYRAHAALRKQDVADVVRDALRDYAARRLTQNSQGQHAIA